jgi:biotin operon repressor
MNTLANPHIAKLRAAPAPVAADDHPGDALDRWHEEILAEEWQAEPWAEGHRPALPPAWPPQKCASHGADHAARTERAKQRILHILRDGEWMSTREVADARGVASVTAVAKWLRALRDEGRLERCEVNEGRRVAYWRLTGREAAG